MLCCRQIEGLPALSPRLARARELRPGHDGADRGDDVVWTAEPAAADVHDGETAELRALDRGDNRACGVLRVEPFAPTGDRGEDAGDLSPQRRPDELVEGGAATRAADVRATPEEIGEAERDDGETVRVAVRLEHVLGRQLRRRVDAARH